MKMISTKNTENHEGKELILGDERFAIVGAAKATGMKAGLLINFGGHGKLEWRKFVN